MDLLLGVGIGPIVGLAGTHPICAGTLVAAQRLRLTKRRGYHWTHRGVGWSSGGWVVDHRRLLALYPGVDTGPIVGFAGNHPIRAETPVAAQRLRLTSPRGWQSTHRGVGG